MNRKYNVLIRIFFITPAIVALTASTYGDVRHTSDPRDNIKTIAAHGDFVWDLNKTDRFEWVKEAKESGKELKVREIRWTVKGKGQDWVFTRTTRMMEDNKPTIKKEGFWISILKADGVWVTRTKYRYKAGKYKEGDTSEVTLKNKGSKYRAYCRITGKKIILALTRKKKAFIYEISQTDGSMRVHSIAVPGVIDRTIVFKKL